MSGYLEIRVKVQSLGYTISGAQAATEIVHDIRHQKPVGLKGDYHPLARLPLEEHPFGLKR